MNKLKKKMGRPTENPKTERIGIRIAKRDLEILEYCSNVLGDSRADVIAKGIRKVYDELTKESETTRGVLENELGNKYCEQIEKKVMYKDSGNGWSTVQIVLPISWVNDMGVEEKAKDVVLSYNDKDKEIIIKKSK